MMQFDPARGRLLDCALALGAVTMLPGCNFDDLQHPNLAGRLLRVMSGWNNEVQAWPFNPSTLAPTYKPSHITRPPRFNPFSDVSQAPQVDVTTWRLELARRIAETQPWRIEQLCALPQKGQITRLICVKVWRVDGRWSGVPPGDFLRAVNADLKAYYVALRCADGHFTSIDMPSALHPQTILALGFSGVPLTAPFGARVRLRIPTKLGFKNPKSIVSMEVTRRWTGGYWANQGYNWFSGS